MTDYPLTTTYARVPAMSVDAVDKVRKLETLARTLPQLEFVTEHLIHGGMYIRSVSLPAGALITGALIKLATTLILQGEMVVYLDQETVHLYGWNVLPASAGRKQAFVAVTDIHMAMMFPTTATTVEECEKQFTDEATLLPPLSAVDRHKIVITGE